MPSTRSTQKRQAILDAARTVFLRHGYRDVSMDQVAAEAGVSKVTIYKHFTDKRSLFTGVITERIADADGETPALTADRVGPDLGRDLRRLARETINTVLDPEIVRLRRIVIGGADEFPELAAVWYRDSILRSYQELAELFAGLAAAGRLRVKEPMIAAQHFLWLVLSVPLNEAMFRADDRPPAPAEVRRYADRGVRAFLAAYGSQS